MDVSPPNSAVNSFKKWSKDHLPGSNDDDRPGGATPLAIKALPSDRGPLREARYRPWVIPGVGGSF